MQPATLPPWLSPWSTGLLYGQRMYKGALRERYRPRDRQRPRLTIYTYNHDATHTHSILRIGGWGAGGENGVGKSGASQTVRPLVGWERFGADRDPPWRLGVQPPPPPPPADLYREMHMELPASPAPPPALSPGSAPRGEGGNWVSTRGWIAGTALLALLVVLARAAENCIDKRFFKGQRRRRSEEWPTPNVRATSQQQQGSESGRPGERGPIPTLSVDLPPPYSSCSVLPPSLRSASPKLASYPEEPPPPYSDCYVEFSNKNGIPSVLIFSRRRNSILNRHEIVGNRSEDEPSTSDGRIDDNDAVMLEDIIVEGGRDRMNDEVTTDQTTERNRSEQVRVTEHDRTEPVPSTSNATDADIPIVIVSETNDSRDNAQVV